MKLNFLSLAALAACVSLASCQNDENPVAQTTARSLNNVSVGINGVVNSRAGITATQFSGTEQIGLYVFGGQGIDDATDARDYTKGTAGNVKKPINRPYKHVGEGVWTYAAEPIILSTNVGKLYSYYPYADGNDDAKAVAVNVVSDQATGQSDGTKDDGQTDYMYGSVVEGLSNSTETANIVMNHALARLQFKFVRDTYPGDAIISRIEVKNTTNGEYLKIGAGTMNIGTGAIAVTGAAGSVFCAPTKQDLADETVAANHPSMLVYPTAEVLSQGTLLINITMDGQVYEIPLPYTAKKDGASEAYKFEAGKNYVYTFKLTGKGFGDEEDDVKVTITPWTDVEVDEGTLEEPIA